MSPCIISAPTQWRNRLFCHAVGSSQCRTSGWTPIIAPCPGAAEHESLSLAKRPAPSVRRCSCSAVPDIVPPRDQSQQSHPSPNAVLELAKSSPGDTKSAHTKPMVGNVPDTALIISLAVAQVVTLTGSLVGGKLARKRRCSVLDCLCNPDLPLPWRNSQISKVQLHVRELDTGAVLLSIIADIHYAVQVRDGTAEQQVTEGVLALTGSQTFTPNKLYDCIGLLF